MPKFSLYPFILVFLFTGITYVEADQPTLSNASPLALKILSSKTLNGVAGDFVTVKAQITNLSPYSVSDITTYLSLVDMRDKLPVDLEDWSAERGLYIGTIDSGQTFPLSWKIHFVKSGDYALMVIALTASDEVPQVSNITHFNVQPKRNLNPGQVLPVALGTPVLVALLMLLMAYRRLSAKLG
jgi:hypothetical protein